MNVVLRNLSLAFLFVVVLPAQAEDQWAFNVDNTFANAFVSGSSSITWVDGVVWMPSAAARYTSGNHQFGSMLWAVVNLDDTVGFDNAVDNAGQGQSDRGNVTEWDVFLDYTYSGLDSVDLSLGYIRYEFNRLNLNTEDVYVKLAAKGVVLNPSLTWLYDVDGGNEGHHATLAFSESFDLSGQDVVLFASVSWADEHYGAAYFSDDGQGDSGVSNWGVGVKTSFAYSDNLAITPSLSYHKLTNDQGVLGATFEQLEAANYEGDKDDNVVFSLSLNYTF